MKKLSYVALFAASCMVLIAQGPTAFTRIRMLIVATGSTHQPLIETTLTGTTTPFITMDVSGLGWIEPANGLIIRPGQGVSMGVSNVGDGYTEDQQGNPHFGNLQINPTVGANANIVGLLTGGTNHLLDFQTFVAGSPNVYTTRGFFEGWGGTNPFAFHAPGLVFPVTYTVSTLPTCSGSNKTGQAVVTDATTPTYLGTLIGGGAVTVPVQCNGTNWVSY